MRGLVNSVLMQNEIGEFSLCIIGSKADLRIYVLVEKAAFALRENVQIRLSGELHLQMIARAPDVEEKLRRELVLADTTVEQLWLKRDDGAHRPAFHFSERVLRLQQMLPNVINAAA